MLCILHTTSFRYRNEKNGGTYCNYSPLLSLLRGFIFVKLWQPRTEMVHPFQQQKIGWEKYVCISLHFQGTQKLKKNKTRLILVIIEYAMKHFREL